MGEEPLIRADPVGALFAAGGAAWCLAARKRSPAPRPSHCVRSPQSKKGHGGAGAMLRATSD
jgi:hypothetical protein